MILRDANRQRKREANGQLAAEEPVWSLITDAVRLRHIPPWPSKSKREQITLSFPALLCYFYQHLPQTRLLLAQ